MSFCHECGSEVAENDVFCPYCGITLTPVAPMSNDISDVTPPEEETFESTIVMSKSDVALHDLEFQTNIEPENVEPSDNLDVLIFDSPEETNAEESVIEVAEAEEPTPIVETFPETETTEAEVEIEDIESIEAEEIVTPPVISYDDMPEPPAIIDLEDSVGQNPPAPPINGDFDEVSEVSDESEKDVIEGVGEHGSEHQQIEAEANEINEPDVFSQPEIEPVYEVDEDTPAEESVETTSEVVVEDVIEEIPLVESLPQEIAVEQAQSIEEIKEAEPEILKTETPISDDSDPGIAGNTKDIFSEREIFRNEGISRPAEELPSDELYKSAPMFDSVRIIEESQNLPMPEPGVDVPETADDDKQVKNTDEELTPPDENGSSFTKSNIGGAESEAKKGSKLKPLSEGTVLNNRYEIIRKIGGGGMGAVYLASDNNLGGVLRAVKEMVQAHIEDEQQEKAINDFKRESTILSSLDHASIPTIFDYFYDDKESRFYLVMKYISGGDLATRLRAAPDGKLSELTITEWAIQILDVLDYLHNLPTTIVYRDLKPSNIMIDGNSGRMMLIDFGIARSINHKEEKGVTAVGTMGYAPPELFSGKVEPRSDIYSLGSTMFHLMTGADPQSNPLLIFDFQKNPLPRQINPQLSDQMELILMRAVEYNAEARFINAAEMKKALEEHLYKLKGGDVTFGVKEAPKSVSLQNQSVFCGFCGQNIVATDLFCAFCGAKQPIAQHGVHSEIYTQAQQTAKLIIYGTNELQNPSFVLSKDVNLVGRRDPMSNIFPEVDLSKYDPQTKISRRHARIWRDGSNFLVEDLGSSNGTIVFPKISDAMKLAPNQTFVLNNGDQIKIGDTTLHFVFN